MQLFEEIEKIVSEAKKDAENFYSKGNKAAGTRLRKAMQEIKNKAQEVRKEVTEKKSEQREAWEQAFFYASKILMK